MSRLTNALDHAAFVSIAPQRTASAAYWRSFLAVAVVLAVAAAFAVGQDAASASAVEVAGPDLTRLLRFMAVVKASLAAGAVGLVWWRSGYPATLRSMLSYAVACLLMAAAPGLIWSMAHVALAAVMFHAGLALLLLVCWTDRGSARDLIRERGQSSARRIPGKLPISAG